LVSAYSSTSNKDSVAEFTDRLMIGASDGFTLRNDGGFVISAGRCRCAWLSADWTSSAAPSMLRSRSNWTVISLSPRTLVELSDVTPAIEDSCFSIGVATDDAMVSAPAPSRVAVITMVGKSTLGSALIGSWR
jgi:hypothetical protein